MITIYKDIKDIPENLEYIELNDLYFNQTTVQILDEQAQKIVDIIDGARLVGKYKMESKFNGTTLNVDCLSTGCKTVLNVLYFPDKVFCLKECGDNALEVLYSLKHGAVYSDYALIPFDMREVCVLSGRTKRTIADYEELKEWWKSEE